MPNNFFNGFHLIIDGVSYGIIYQAYTTDSPIWILNANSYNQNQLLGLKLESECLTGFIESIVNHLDNGQGFLSYKQVLLIPTNI